PWRWVNLAIPDQPGGCTASAGVFTVAGGASLKQPDDAGRFLYQSLSNNLQIVSHVLRLPQRDPSPRTGLMIRQSLEVGAPAVVLFVDGKGKLGFLRRCCVGEPVMLDTGGAAGASVWLRLIRQESTYLAAQSSDGANWAEVGRATFPMTNVA